MACVIEWSDTLVGEAGYAVEQWGSEGALGVWWEKTLVLWSSSMEDEWSNTEINFGENVSPAAHREPRSRGWEWESMYAL